MACIFRSSNIFGSIDEADRPGSAHVLVQGITVAVYDFSDGHDAGQMLLLLIIGSASYSIFIKSPVRMEKHILIFKVKSDK